MIYYYSARPREAPSSDGDRSREINGRGVTPEMHESLLRRYPFPFISHNFFRQLMKVTTFIEFSESLKSYANHFNRKSGVTGPD